MDMQGRCQSYCLGLVTEPSLDMNGVVGRRWLFARLPAGTLKVGMALPELCQAGQ